MHYGSLHPLSPTCIINKTGTIWSLCPALPYRYRPSTECYGTWRRTHRRVLFVRVPSTTSSACWTVSRGRAPVRGTRPALTCTASVWRRPTPRSLARRHSPPRRKKVSTVSWYFVRVCVYVGALHVRDHVRVCILSSIFLSSLRIFGLILIMLLYPFWIQNGWNIVLGRAVHIVVATNRCHRIKCYSVKILHCYQRPLSCNTIVNIRMYLDTCSKEYLRMQTFLNKHV